MAARNLPLLGLSCVSAAALAWSTSGLFTRAIDAETATILFWRGVFGAAGMAALMLLRPGGVRAGDLRLGLGGWLYAGVTALSMLFFISALRSTTVAHVAILTATVPFLAIFLALVLLRDPPPRGAIAASAGALAGVAIMVGVGAEGQVSGDALAGLMALCMAGMIVISRRWPALPALPATAVASLLTALAVAPFLTWAPLSWRDLGLLALFGLVNQTLGFGLFAIGARWLPPARTALITALDAPLAPLWVWLVFAETPAAPTLLGGAVVMAAVAWFLWPRTE